MIAFAFQLRQFLQGLEVGGMLETPPMELQQIDALDIEPCEARCRRPRARRRAASARAWDTIW
jgi:hypothetical protein